MSTKPASDHETSPCRSAKAQKADEVQAAGSAKAGAGHPVVDEGGKVEPPKKAKGQMKPAASRAHGEGSPAEGTTSGVVGKAEQHAAHEAGMAKEQHGRGHRKGE